MMNGPPECHTTITIIRNLTLTHESQISLQNVMRVSVCVAAAIVGAICMGPATAFQAEGTSVADIAVITIITVLTVAAVVTCHVEPQVGCAAAIMLYCVWGCKQCPI